jgi:hypothetical protein
MADQKVSDLPSLNGVDVDAADLLYIIDSSAGTAGSKKITVGQYQLAPYSAGTANGVMYLNGSNVVTTGSGLVFDGTNLGIGTSSPGAKLEVASGKVLLSNTQSYAIKTAAGVTCDVVTLTSGNVLQLGGGGATDSVQFWNQGLERMRLDSSGNLGIGTSSPGAKLDVSVADAATATRLIAATGRLRLRPYADATNGTIVDATNTAESAYQPLTLIGSTLRLFGNSGTGAVIDSSGNLGLGVTPSAWSLGKAIEVNSVGNALWGAAASEINVSQNAYYNSGWKYAATSFATRYEQNTGVHRWYTAPSGTAGNAISFTQAMTLDASGNLDLGTTGGSDRYQNIIATSARLTFNAGTGFTGSAATSIYNQSAIAMVFGTNNTERARITSGGDLLVGTTSSAGAGGITFLNQGSTGFADINNNNAGATGYVFQSFRRSSVEIGSITQNGTTGVLYNITSDRRLKDNIVPAPSASDDIDAIQIVSHDWKSAPDEHVKYGVVAQDLHMVAPQAVSPGDDGDEIERTWGVDYSKLVPMLIKEIQSLRARVAALEAQ